MNAFKTKDGRIFLIANLILIRERKTFPEDTRILPFIYIQFRFLDAWVAQSLQHLPLAQS